MEKTRGQCCRLSRSEQIGYGGTETVPDFLRHLRVQPPFSCEGSTSGQSIHLNVRQTWHIHCPQGLESGVRPLPHCSLQSARARGAQAPLPVDIHRSRCAVCPHLRTDRKRRRARYSILLSVPGGRCAASTTVRAQWPLTPTPSWTAPPACQGGVGGHHLAARYWPQCIAPCQSGRLLPPVEGHSQSGCHRHHGSQVSLWTKAEPQEAALNWPTYSGEPRARRALWKPSAPEGGATTSRAPPDRFQRQLSLFPFQRMNRTRHVVSRALLKTYSPSYNSKWTNVYVAHTRFDDAFLNCF